MNPTNEHKEQAREIVLRLLRLRSDTELAGVYAEMVDVFAAALSSRDAEVSGVLEGLRNVNGCWCAVASDPHEPECLAASDLYTKLQPKQ